jgi:glycosyltransferase involved in cell wall biosynthesis
MTAKHQSLAMQLLKPVALSPLSGSPLVSILVSNYNYGSYLSEAIESVLGQTYRNFELIICDDGSTDTSAEVLDRYGARDPRILVTRQNNGGQAQALNTAFRQSQGEVICFLDSDDIFMPEKLQRIVDAFSSERGAGFAVNRMIRVDRLRNRLGETPLIAPLPSGWCAPRLKLLAPEVLPGLPPSSGLSLRRSVAETFFPLPEGLRAAADTMIQILAPMSTPIVPIDSPLSEYRVQHGANVGAVRAFTAEQLRRRVAWEKELWRGWRAYLARTASDSGLTIALPEVDAVSVQAYAAARFESRPDFKDVFRLALRGGWFNTMPRLYRWYWRASVFLPSRAFQRSFAFVYGQSPAKICVGRVLSAYHSIKRKMFGAGKRV